MGWEGGKGVVGKPREDRNEVAGTVLGVTYFSH